MRDVIIIGSGPAGLTAALYAARANLAPLLIEGLESGGQLMLTTMVENFPGYRGGIMGPDLIAEMRAQAERFGTEIINGDVTAVELGSQPFIVRLGTAMQETKALILATGASARLLGLPSERTLMGHGVSTCATCDGYFFRNKPIAVATSASEMPAMTTEAPPLTSPDRSANALMIPSTVPKRPMNGALFPSVPRNDRPRS